MDGCNQVAVDDSVSGLFSLRSHRLRNIDIGIVEKFMPKVEKCGLDEVCIVDRFSGDSLLVPNYCDNRCCTNPLCQEHRGYQYMKAHLSQVTVIDESINVPKAWVFTTCKCRRSEVSREYLSFLMSKLVALLKRFSLTAFTVHMEIKLYPLFFDSQDSFCVNCSNRGDCHQEFGRECADRDSAFVHFHVISGSINNLGLVRKLWGYRVSVENSRFPDSVAKYVSKYASKNAYYQDVEAQVWYGAVTYKLKMHFFSVSPNLVLGGSQWLLSDNLVREIQWVDKRHIFYGDYFTDRPPPGVEWPDRLKAAHELPLDDSPMVCSYDRFESIPGAPIDYRRRYADILAGAGWLPLDEIYGGAPAPMVVPKGSDLSKKQYGVLLNEVWEKNFPKVVRQARLF